MADWVPLVTGLYWPIVVGGALYGFSKPIGDLFGRVAKLKGFGAEAELTPAPVPSQIIELETSRRLPPPAPSQEGGAKSALPPPVPVLSPAETHLRHQLVSTYPEDLLLQREWAIRFFALASTERQFETTYRIIFGSQIEVLQSFVAPVPLSALLPVYDRARAAFPALYAKLEFRDWWTFLTTQGLLRVDVDPEETTTVTPLGRQFLIWMTERGVVPTKFG